MGKEYGSFIKSTMLEKPSPTHTPTSAEGYFLSGNKLLTTGQAQAASEHYLLAIQRNAKHHQAFNNLGVAYQRMNKLEAALHSFEQSLAINHNSVDAHYNRGNVLKELGDNEAAIQSYKQALSLNPNYSSAHYNLGNSLLALTRYEPALASFDSACAIRTDHAPTWNNRGTVLRHLERLPEAVKSFQRAVAIDPLYANAHYNLANTLKQLQLNKAAQRHYEETIRLEPKRTSTYINLATVLIDMHQYANALLWLDKAIALDSTQAAAHNNRGTSLRGLKKFLAALQAFDTALALDDQLTDAWYNRGNLLHEMQRHSDALLSYERGIDLSPHSAKTHWNYSLCLLTLGHYEKGWREYEWRWRVDEFKKSMRHTQYRLWLGHESLQNKTILLHSEQGLGDSLQFCRYVQRVETLGATVILQVPSSLASLLQASLNGVATLVTVDDPVPPADYQCPLMSLPLALRLYRPEAVSAQHYLSVAPEFLNKWQSRLDALCTPRRLRIGLAWSGSSTHKNDANRSMPLAQLLRGIPAGIDCISLQKEIRPADAQTLTNQPNMIHFGNDLHDLHDTAALCECVDVVVCVDTSLAHLAGALGKPVWLLLPLHCDWRWLTQRTDSPWYPATTLYRQRTAGNWDDVIAQVYADLLQKIQPIPTLPEMDTLDMSKTTLPEVSISDDGDTRYLHLGTPWIQGSMRVKKPFEIDLDYVQRMMAWLLFMPEVSIKALGERHAMQLGLGAAALTKFCYKKLRMKVTAVELNPQVVNVCHQWFKLPPDDERLNIVLADAAKEISKKKWLGTVDALQVDLYDDDAAAPVLDSAEHYAACRQLLTDEGVMTVNLFGRNASYAQSLAKIVQAFGSDCVWAFRPTKEGNTVVLALRTAQQISREALAHRADAIQTAVGLPAKKWLRILQAPAL